MWTLTVGEDLMNPNDVLRWGEVIDTGFVELVPTLFVGENNGESKESGECSEAPMPLKEVSSSSEGG